jgi:hypothetical protein
MGKALYWTGPGYFCCLIDLVRLVGRECYCLRI